MSNSQELLRGKKVIVIGGSSGIGRSVAAAALAHGASVVISSSSQDRVNAAIEKLKQDIEGKPNVSVNGQAFDLKDFNALKEFLSKEGPFDHLVITAGTLLKSLELPTDGVPEHMKDQFDMRYWAVIIAAQHINKNNLIRPDGSITLTTGIGIYRPVPGWALANGMTGAVESSTRGLAVDLKPIRVNAVAVGLVDTELLAQLPAEAREITFKAFTEKLLVARAGTPDEVAEAYIFAMKCTYFTGQVITVDGGAVLV